MSYFNYLIWIETLKLSELFELIEKTKLFYGRIFEFPVKRLREAVHNIEQYLMLVSQTPLTNPADCGVYFLTAVLIFTCR